MTNLHLPENLRNHRSSRLPDRPTSPERFAQRGVAIVEFAMLLPVLLFFVMGVLEVGSVLHVQKHLLGAAHSGARTGAIQRSTVSEVNNALQTYLGNTILNGAYTAAIVGVGASSTGDTLVTVTVNYNFPIFFAIPALGWNDASVPLSATVTLRHE